MRKGDSENGLSFGGASVVLLLLEVPVISARMPVLVAARTSEGRLAEHFSGEPRAVMSSSGASMKMSKAVLNSLLLAVSGVSPKPFHGVLVVGLYGEM
jgi:hypothetical protein